MLAISCMQEVTAGGMTIANSIDVSDIDCQRVGVSIRMRR